MRYALELAYRGTGLAGWQRQPNALSVEELVDTALSTILGERIKIVGCGRTDAGVHASHYVAHFDYAGELPPAFRRRYDRFVDERVAILGVYRVRDGFHARFDATARAYVYRIATYKDPFRPDTVTSLPQLKDVDQDRMRAAAALLLDYTAFAPFCKTNSDAFTMNCTLTRAEWIFNGPDWEFHVGANRFLRGMVRLIVGMCLRVGEGKLELAEVRRALEEQRGLGKPWSAPGEGLYLSNITYPGREAWEAVG